MREILGDVLGNNFKGITLKSYNKALKKVEDKEDYETGKLALKSTEDDNLEDELEDHGEEDAEEGGFDQIVDIEKIISVLPHVYVYGLKLIEKYSGSFDAFKDEEEDQPEEDKDSRVSDESADQQDSNMPMHPPRPLDRATTLSIIKDEKVRFQKYYGFAQ